MSLFFVCWKGFQRYRKREKKGKETVQVKSTSKFGRRFKSESTLYNTIYVWPSQLKQQNYDIERQLKRESHSLKVIQRLFSPAPN